ncbi:MAG: malonate decarboxylase acyl carrier protein [Neisseriaceae bacterium]|nr:malonate decarboxylase acyl carrier protein [Neisseriaceae bacterium]MBP6861531.1 malonate decarboxylase acyl carrier protein [Neisseriaceae bacterium]
MEQFTYSHPATEKVSGHAHVGVVGSGDLEVLITAHGEGRCEIEVVTGSDGFETTWRHILARFCRRHPIGAHILIHDFGATPGVVNLRLAQAVEILYHEPST